MAKIELELQPPLARLWLSRPEVANAIDADMLTELGQAIDRLAQTTDVRVLLLRGRGGKFCAGADLRKLTASGAGLAQLDAELSPLLERLASLPMVVVGVLERFALGGGFLIALCCDWRVATTGAKLGFTRQWVPPCGLSRLAAWLGAARAEQMLVARPALSAEEAYRLGLVDQVIAAEGLEALLSCLADEFSQSRGDVIRELRAYFAQFRGRPHGEWDKISSAAFERTFAHPEAQRAISQLFSSKEKLA